MTTSPFSISKHYPHGRITERQRDEQTREVKCVIAGITRDGSSAEAVVKVGFTGKLIVITVYIC